MIRDDSFEKAYLEAEVSEREKAARLIVEGDRAGLERWFKSVLKNSKLVEEFSTSDLRLLCRDLGIKNYRYHTKQMMISAIKKETPDARDTSAGGN
jgi:hypothetical protein